MTSFDFSRSDFPKQFLFGTATSSYQIEGHAQGGAGRTNWDDFAATPGNVVRAEHGDLACDHYNRFEEDLDLVAAAGLDAYRFSLSWARVMPEGRGAVNQQGLDFYDRLTDAMLARGLKPCATLYHWELPSPLADLGGWRNRDIANWLGDYTDVVMGRLGDRMHSVAPINEPWCISWLSHFTGAHAPGLRDVRAAARSMHHVLLAHGTAIQRMRALGMKNLGGVFNFEYAHPASSSPADIAAAALYDDHYNNFFLSGVFHKTYPKRMIDGFGAHLPQGWQDDLDTIAQPLDWCGLNYYTCARVAPADGPWPHFQTVEGPLPKTQMGWEIYPEGLYKFLTRTKEKFTGDLPLFITENGMSNADQITNGAVPDPERIAYVEAHIAQVKRAIDAGVPVEGYFLWSLMDNYEWALGYEKRFGMVHVDFDTLARTPKSSYYALQSALQR
jgi:beta-glucosidase